MKARISNDGQRLILSMSYSEDNVAFCRSLPAAKFDKPSITWACTNTPAACWRVYLWYSNICENSSLDEGIIERARQIAQPPFDLGTELDYEDQPAIRTLDAWPHQLGAYWFVNDRESAMLAMDMATGKSKVAIDLVVNRDCCKILIVCPKAVMAVWRREWTRHTEYVDPLILDRGSAKSKIDKINSYMKPPLLNRAVVVLNYDTARTPAMAKDLLSRQWDAVILDESHRAKGPNTATAKFVAKLGKRADFRLCLTGTPMPHSPLDLYGQFLFLDPGMYGTSWAGFRNHFAVSGFFGKNQIVGYKNLDELKMRFKQMSYRVEACDVLDLPPETDSRILCKLPAKTQKVYDGIQNDLIAEIDAGTITVANALTKLVRLQQLTSGLAVTGEGEERAEHEIDTTKKDTLHGWLASHWVMSDGPVVVFCRWRHDLKSVRDIAESLGKRYGELSGSQNDLTDEGTMPEGIDLLGVQIQAGREGVDVTRAHVQVYYSIGFSLGDYLQSRRRINRPGQEHPVAFHHLIAEGTVDEHVYKVLEKREDLVNGVLSILKGRNDEA